MNPADLHKVDELKSRIADGSYRADPEELADLLLGEKEPAPRPRRG
jgi:anti-sigma28 factor (negative regulator of flagellin synthesis)